MIGKKIIPPNMPQPIGLGFILNAKVDADNIAFSLTRRPRTGFLV